jgi:hypothetical protein
MTSRNLASRQESPYYQTVDGRPYTYLDKIKQKKRSSSKLRCLKSPLGGFNQIDMRKIEKVKEKFTPPKIESKELNIEDFIEHVKKMEKDAKIAETAVSNAKKLI